MQFATTGKSDEQHKTSLAESDCAMSPPPQPWDGTTERRAPNQITAQAIEDAVTRGIVSAVSNPNTWELAGKAMRAQAEASAGGWLLGAIRSAAKKLAWIALIFIGVYSLGGANAVVALLKGQGFGNPP